jgi:hypothetical protein
MGLEARLFDFTAAAGNRLCNIVLGLVARGDFFSVPACDRKHLALIVIFFYKADPGGTGSASGWTRVEPRGARRPIRIGSRKARIEAGRF